MTLGHIEEQKGKNKIANCKNNKPISLPLDMSKGQKLTIWILTLERAWK